MLKEILVKLKHFQIFLKECVLQRDSNWNRQRRGRALRPPYHHHSHPFLFNLSVHFSYKAFILVNKSSNRTLLWLMCEQKSVSYVNLY